MAENGQGLAILDWAVVMHITLGVTAFAVALFLGILGSGYRRFPILRLLGISVLVVVCLQLA